MTESHCTVCNQWIPIVKNRTTIRDETVCPRSLCHWAAWGIGDDIINALASEDPLRALVLMQMVGGLEEYDTLQERVQPLIWMGMDNKTIADLLGTTPPSVRSAKAAGQKDE